LLVRAFVYVCVWCLWVHAFVYVGGGVLVRAFCMCAWGVCGCVRLCMWVGVCLLVRAFVCVVGCLWVHSFVCMGEGAFVGACAGVNMGIGVGVYVGVGVNVGAGQGLDLGTGMSRGLIVCVGLFRLVQGCFVCGRACRCGSGQGSGRACGVTGGWEEGV